ncbi:hypothetical protein [Rhodococcoides fascians]|uniref:Uncharacterized protein n=1 Tax=Rhodococcoides fascians TaxID=1828 RepID=A0A143QTB5_RHOFA|nr:hypothetical protein [Rhodococcus fascians]AMY26224.1 hypothetical protein A3Q41_04969 [Rhodococcus fascians]OZC38144.1 hypothetical protein CHX23_23770 [Rhodococcus fascians]
MTANDNDDYWTTYDKALDAAAECRSVETLIDTLNRYYPPSSGVAFFPNGADRDLLGTLTDAGHFDTVWVQADYHFALRDGRGDGFTYIEGDIVRGTARR